ncbi:MAG TPA: DNA-3-methyladenine glycosylase [Bryobacteraceae bacterium]|jgi:DNA-3-methyladenine glycosylase|nr:DNA-3-methyladenine glycosylase [Bryobacteraceae bacterium]
MRWTDPIALKDLIENSQILPEAFYARPTVTVARDLLGKVLIHKKTAGRIIEVEAYLGLDDLAAHASRGLTDRTRVLFGPPGRAYVYLSYGVHECLNFVAEPDGIAGCVLIRALEPLCGLEIMRARRPAAREPRQLCSGPGKLTAALAITRALNGANVTQEGEFMVRTGPPPAEIVTTKRIGITKCVDWLLRFYEKNNPFVSR